MIMYLLVASSSSNILLLRARVALAKQNNCLCPADKCVPRISASAPPIPRICSVNPTFSNAAWIWDSVASFRGSRLERTVPLVPGRNHGSCGSELILPRMVSGGKEEMSSFPMKMAPDFGSNRRRRSPTIVDLPEPVRPHIATRWPASIERLNFCTTSGPEALGSLSASCQADKSL